MHFCLELGKPTLSTRVFEIGIYLDAILTNYFNWIAWEVQIGQILHCNQGSIGHQIKQILWQIQGVHSPGPIKGLLANVMNLVLT